MHVLVSALYFTTGENTGEHEDNVTSPFEYDVTYNTENTLAFLPVMCTSRLLLSFCYYFKW